MHSLVDEGCIDKRLRVLSSRIAAGMMKCRIEKWMEYLEFTDTISQKKYPTYVSWGQYSFVWKVNGQIQDGEWDETGDAQ